MAKVKVFSPVPFPCEPCFPLWTCWVRAGSRVRPFALLTRQIIQAFNFTWPSLFIVWRPRKRSLRCYQCNATKGSTREKIVAGLQFIGTSWHNEERNNLSGQIRCTHFFTDMTRTHSYTKSYTNWPEPIHYNRPIIVWVSNQRIFHRWLNSD